MNLLLIKCQSLLCFKYYHSDKEKQPHLQHRTHTSLKSLLTIMKLSTLVGRELHATFLNDSFNEEMHLKAFYGLLTIQSVSRP